MKITNVGVDYINIDEDILRDIDPTNFGKIHLIKMSFKEPTVDKMDSVLMLFPKTNRFIVDTYIKDYNNYFKRTTKKYYIENIKGSSIISFFRKNNKVLLNFNRLTKPENTFILENCFDDVLRNLEVICINQNTFRVKRTH